MSNETLKKRLLALTTSQDRSIARRMADVLPEIEAALEGGASRAQVIEVLNQEGIAVTPQVFATYIHRLRAANRSIPAPAVAAPEPVAAERRPRSTATQRKQK
jgi:hypothetical protein